MPIERKDKLLDFSKYWIFGYHIICKMSLQCDNSIRSIGYTLHQEPCNAFCSTNWFMWIPLKKESSNWYFFIFFNAAPQWFDVVGQTKEGQFPQIRIHSISSHKLFHFYILSFLNIFLING